MKKITKPWWILLVNTLPIIILFIIMGNDFTLIRSLLSEESIRLWIVFGSVLGIYGVLNLVYASILIAKKRDIHLIYIFIALASSIAIFYVYVMYMEDIIPFSIPQWMIPGERFIYVGTFLMPTIAYSIFALVVKLTSLEKKFNALISFGITLAIPLSIYLFSTLIFPSFYSLTSKFSEHVFIVLFVAATVLFLFFLIRSFYIVINKKADKWKKFQLAWKIPVVLVLPLLGLYINLQWQYFGDYTSRWFYIVCIVNGVMLCLPDFKNRVIRLSLFAGRVLTFPFSLYFFVVFIPFLPLSVAMIIALGAGFLMLTPIALFLIHTGALIEDFKYLKSSFELKILIVTGTICSLIIPVVIIVNFYNDKRNLNRALNYIYSPDYSREYSIDTSSLKYTMENVEDLRNTNRDFFDSSDYTPYISTLYNRIVFNNLTLSNSKINEINRVFFNDEKTNGRSGNSVVSGAELTDFSVDSYYDKKQDAWISTLDLELTNNSGFGLQEYVTEFNLPEGCWISDYYLYVNGVKEPGILSEKKSAMWIYSQIKNRDRRDPGILYYLTGNRVHFSVFPFFIDEVRKTGITFTHKEPAKLVFDNKVIELGYKINRNIEKKSFSDSGVVFISGEDKRLLDVVERKPYYHFVVDTSEYSDVFIEQNVRKINNLLDRNYIDSSEAVISFTNSYVNTLKLGDDFSNLYESQKFQGGFFLDRAIKKILFDSYTDPENRYPVIVVVSDNFYNGIITKDFSDFTITYPDSSFFYVLNKDGDLNTHSLLSNPFNKLDIEPELYNIVYAYPDSSNPTAYLPVNDEGSLVITDRDIDINRDTEVNSWINGLHLQGMWIIHNLYPDETDENWKKLVRNSFKTGIMTPVTSYIVVENEAQRIALKRKQDEVLKGKESLDLMEEEPIQMSEPGFILLLVVVMLFLYLKKRKRYSV